jgi:pentapeptide MXKDX repeat protein
MKKIVAITAMTLSLSFATTAVFAQSGDGMAKDGMAKEGMAKDGMGKSMDHEKMGKHHDMMKKEGDKMGEGMKKDEMSK